MPKFSTSARHASHPDGKKIKKSKHRGNQYRDAAKARKIRKTRIKGIVEEVVETVEPGKAKPLRRGPKYDFAKIERKLRASCEDNQPVNIPIIPAEVYGGNPVNFNVPRIMVPTSEATAKRKQAAAGEDDGDATDVDDSEDNIVVPAGFVDAAEKLGLLSAPVASSGPHEEIEEPSSTFHVQLDEKPPTERLSTEIRTPSSPAVPQTISSEPCLLSSTHPSHLVSEPVLVEAVHNDSQTTAATSFPTYPESSEFNVPISVPQAPSIPESFQEAAWSSASQDQNPTFWVNNMDDVHFHQQANVSEHQNPTCWVNNMNDAQASHFHQPDISNASYLGPASDDVNMEFSGASTMEPSVYSLPTMWISPQPQPDYQTFYPHVGQIADNNSYYQAYAMGNIHPNWTSMQFQPVQNESVQQSAQTDQLPYNHAADPLTAASCFWTALSGNPGTSQSPTTAPKIVKSTPTQVDEQQPQEEPTKLSLLIRQDSYQDRRRGTRTNNEGIHPFPGLRRYKNMRLINMSRESEEPCVALSWPSRHCLMTPPVGSEIDLINRLSMEAECHEAPPVLKMKHRKRRHEDSLSDFTRTSNPDIEGPSRQRRRCEPKSKIPVPAQKRSRKLHQQCEASLKGQPLTSSRTPTGWNVSRSCPPISSLADRLFKLF